ncbi:MAG: hypothetical protein GY749_39500 [Desulfobacteraceae bacterium]|nr:hypothetical protein [Desulfobacteraceae bacterium]
MTTGMQERIDTAVAWVVDTAVAWVAERVERGPLSDTDWRTLVAGEDGVIVAVDPSFDPVFVWVTDDPNGPHAAARVWLADGVVHGAAFGPDGTEYGAEQMLGGF